MFGLLFLFLSFSRPLRWWNSTFSLSLSLFFRKLVHAKRSVLRAIHDSLVLLSSFWLLGEAFHAAYSSSVSSRIIILGDIHMQRWNILHTHFLSIIGEKTFLCGTGILCTHTVSPRQLFRNFLPVKIWNRTVISEQNVTDGIFFPSLGVINDVLNRRYRESESKDKVSTEVGVYSGAPVSGASSFIVGFSPPPLVLRYFLLAPNTFAPSGPVTLMAFDRSPSGASTSNSTFSPFIFKKVKSLQACLSLNNKNVPLVNCGIPPLSSAIGARRFLRSRRRGRWTRTLWTRWTI